VTTTLYLVRHGDNDTVGKRVAGRSPGVRLNAVGRAQAQAVADRLADEPIAAIYASPLERTQETAAPLASRLGVPVRAVNGLLEIDFGAWTGRTLEDLDADPAWGAWNRQRSLHRAPGGESMGEVQVRAVNAVEPIRAEHAGQAVALVCHGDVIKALVCHWLGLDLDHYDRFDIDPASITQVVVGDWGVKLLRLNERPG
jgi:probable phosphoglycerate mutase